MRTRTAGIAAVMVVAATAGGAGAQTAPDALDLIAAAAAHSHAGDHAGAIALYEQVYRTDQDVDLLVTIGAEYREAGKPNEAIQNYCAYLTVEPRGDRAAFAMTEVASLQASLGNKITFANVCAPGEPMLPPIEPPTVRVGPPTTNAAMSHREITGLGAVGLGLVSLGVGAYFGLEAKDISDQIAGHSPAEAWPADILEREQRGQRAEMLQDVFLVTGAVALATGGYLYITGRSDRLTSERISIAPSVSHSSAGVAIRGGF